jgi:hypothetical protein
MFDCRHNCSVLGPLMEKMRDDRRDEKRASVVAYAMIKGAQQEQGRDGGAQHHDAVVAAAHEQRACGMRRLLKQNAGQRRLIFLRRRSLTLEELCARSCAAKTFLNCAWLRGRTPRHRWPRSPSSSRRLPRSRPLRSRTPAVSRDPRSKLVRWCGARGRAICRVLARRR